ncbi:hypothetical protein FACS1894216_17410 [Synergistales bacterium]|nr:hypothetical protein FACS1894216_17410 [Synergistales bacterium]
MALYKILTHEKVRQVNTDLLSRTTKEYAMLIIAILIWAFMFTEKYIPLFDGADRLLKFGGPSVIFFVLIFKYFENRKAPRFLVVLGDISYSLYITHWILIYSLGKVCNLAVFTPMSAVFALAVVIPLCIGAAWVSWYLVENKFTGFLHKRLIKNEADFCG